MTILGQHQEDESGSYQKLPPVDGTRPSGPREAVAGQPSVGMLVAQLSDQVSHLVREEMRLAELEAKQRGKKAGLSFGAVGLGGGLAFFGACCFVTAAILAMLLVLQPWAAALAVGGMFFFVSVLLAGPGLLGMVRSGRGVGKQSLMSVKADVEALKQAVRHD